MPKYVTKEWLEKNTNLFSWFDLKKYKHATPLIPAEWYEQLFVRWCLYVVFENPKLASKPAKQIHQILSQVRQQGIVSLNESDVVFLSRSDGLRYYFLKDKSEEKRLHRSVAPITLRLLDQIRQEIRGPIQGIHPFLVPIGEIERGKLNIYDFIFIDLTMPDRFIIDDFRSYLKEIRRDPNRQKPVINNRRLSPRKWEKFLILAYLDLLIWEKQNNYSIKDEAIIDILYSDGYPSNKANKTAAAEDIRKVLRKMALNAIDQSTLRKLYSLCVQS